MQRREWQENESDTLSTGHRILAMMPRVPTGAAIRQPQQPLIEVIPRGHQTGHQNLLQAMDAHRDVQNKVVQRKVSAKVVYALLQKKLGDNFGTLQV
jgi:hypothetical protein